MEGGQTQQAASTRWLQFAEWLRQHAGAPAEEAVSEASASDAEDIALAAEQPVTGPSSSTGASTSAQGSLAAVARAAGNSSGGAAPPTPVSPGQLARHATLAPRLPDCRAEMRLTSDSSNRVRQEMTVMLAAPGMPLHEAPVLTAKQAGSLMAAICEPLLSLPVGRLTRKLAAPTKLQPTEDRGLLTLWLLPDDSLSLVWQAAQQLAPATLDEAAGSISSSGGGGGGGGSQLLGLQQSCSVAVWEELVHFPAMAHLLDDAPVVTIHMLRGDSSGRSFYIRVRDDVAEANLEAATAAVPDASRLLQQQQQRAASAAAAGGSTAAPAEVDVRGAPRMYFWLTDQDLGRAVYSLGRLKSLLKRPPTLAKRSGVPEQQLMHLGAWVQSADLAAVQQQQHEAEAAAAAARVQLDEEDEDSGKQPAVTWDEQREESGTSRGTAAVPATPSAAACSRAHGAGCLSPLQQPPGMLLGHSMAAAAQMHGGMAALLPPPPTPSPAQVAPGGAAASSNSSGGVGEDESGAGPLACGSSSVSATAAALYQDQRFNVVCPCTISVVVSMRMQAAGPGIDPALLPAEASARARTVAERQAKSAVDRSGRQRIEERLAEVVIRNIRAQRNRARHLRQQQRDSAAQEAHKARALALAQQATGRSLAPVDASAPQEPEEDAAAVAAPQHDMAYCSPFALAASSSGEGKSEWAAPTGGGAAPALAFPVHAGGSHSHASGRAFSSPAALPMTAALEPGSAVTLANLHSLFSAPRLETTSSQGSATSELGTPVGRSAPAGAAGPGAEGHSSAARVPSSPLSIADLADLLKHTKLE